MGRKQCLGRGVHTVAPFPFTTRLRCNTAVNKAQCAPGWLPPCCAAGVCGCAAHCPQRALLS
jgi:hypothetical protein